VQLKDNSVFEFLLNGKDWMLSRQQNICRNF